MKSIYSPSIFNADVYTKYYANQAGYGDYPPLQTFKGTSYQRGYGIGSIFSSIIRGITPLFQSSFAKQAAKTVGNQLLNTGLQVGKDLLQGQNLKEAAKHRFKQAGTEIMRDMGEQMTNQTGSGRKRRRRKTIKSRVNKKRCGNKRKRKSKKVSKRRKKTKSRKSRKRYLRDILS